MLLRLSIVPVVIGVLSFLAACSDQPDPEDQAVPLLVPEPEAAAQTARAAKTAKTSGVLSFDGLPPDSVDAAEVIVVSSLSDAARERILRQRELFEYKITGRVEAVAGASVVADVLAVDGIRLNARLAQLPSKFPPLRVADIDQGNNRLSKFQSDPELFKEYKYLFDSIQWGNLERGLTFISEKIETDNQALVAQAEGADLVDDFGAQQAEVTLDWLKSVQQHYNTYVALAKDYFGAKKRYIEAEAQSGPKEPSDWDSYVAKYANYLVMDISEHLQGASFAAEDGSFEAEGHGVVVVRVELGMTSAYFLPGSVNEQRVLIKNLQQL